MWAPRLALPALLLLGASSGAGAARVPRSPFPVAARGLNASRELLVLVTDGFSRDDTLLAMTLQGVLSRDAPRMYRYSTAAVGSPPDLEQWLNVTRDVWGVRLNISYATSLPALLLAVRPELVAGTYVLCDLDDNSTNAAVNVAAATGAVAVTTANEHIAVAAGFKLAYDTRGKSVEWAIDTFNGSGGFFFSRSVSVVQDPSKLTLGDFSISSGALQWWSTDMLGSLARRALDSVSGRGAFAVLGWGPDEINTVAEVSRLGGSVVASDWATNVDVLSQFDLPLLSQKSAPAAAVASAVAAAAPPKHTVCFLMSDGDNLQWILGGFMSGRSYFGSPDRGKVALGWTLTPAAADLAPAAMHYLYSLASDGSQAGMPERDVFVAGVSGWGYSYPDVDSAPLANGAALSAGYMLKSGMRIANIMSKGNAVDEVAAAALLAHDNVDAALWYFYSDYAGVRGAISFVGGKPVIGGRFNLWGSTVFPDPTGPTFKNVSTLAEALRAMPTDPTTSEGYSLVALHAWSHNVSDALAVMQLAGDSVEAVAPDEFVRRIVTNLGEGAVTA